MAHAWTEKTLQDGVNDGQKKGGGRCQRVQRVLQMCVRCLARMPRLVVAIVPFPTSCVDMLLHVSVCYFGGHGICVSRCTLRRAGLTP